jgi:hypothetical protein
MKDKIAYIVFSIFVFSVVLLFIFPDSALIKNISNVSTPLLAILTAGYVVLTFFLLRSSQKVMQEQIRPYVVVSLPVDSNFIWLSVRNVGNRPALNVKINISPSLETLSKDGRFKGMADPLLKQSFLPPNYEVKNMISTTLHANDVKPEKRIFTISYSYSDSTGRNYPHPSYTIDMNSVIFGDMVLTKSTEMQLSEISKHLQEISEQLKKE